MQASVHAHYILTCSGQNSGCVQAKNFKFGLKHLQTISRGYNNISSQDQAHKQVCIYPVFLHAWDHISGCVHAKNSKLGMKHL